MITYIGAGFLAFGFFIAIVTSVSFSLNSVAVLAGMVIAMGFVLVALGMLPRSQSVKAPSAMHDDNEDWESEIL